MRLRVRTPSGVISVGQQLTGDSELSKLKDEISSKSNIKPERLLLKLGFPPKPIIENSASKLLLSQVGIKDGEQIVVEEIPAAAESVLKVTSPVIAPPPTSTTSSRSTNVAVSSLKNSKEQVQIVDLGFLVLREQKDDNSCLFNTIGYVMEKSSSNIPRLRKIISDTIASDPFNYNEAILGRDPDEYRRWIVQQNSWGGAIELSIFADYFQTEIDSIDIMNLRADKFGEGKNYSKRVFVLYNGIHYDAIALSPIEDGPLDFDQTAFDLAPASSNTNDDLLLESAIKLASILKAKRKFTDLAGFTLSCGVCKKNLVGQKDAQAHAQATGHTSFTEYSSDN